MNEATTACMRIVHGYVLLRYRREGNFDVSICLTGFAWASQMFTFAVLAIYACAVIEAGALLCEFFIDSVAH